MKTLLAAAMLLALPFGAEAQSASARTVEQRVSELEDRTALRTLVDRFSILADRKDIATQLLLFTEDATVESVSDGRAVSSLNGRKQIGDAFGAYLATFETVYHINGQHTVDIQGDKATGTYYCLVVLIANENGKRIKNTSGVYYDDDYVRRGGSWLIAKRTAHFAWRDREEMSQASR